jgi:hypothetical protein
MYGLEIDGVSAQHLPKIPYLDEHDSADNLDLDIVGNFAGLRNELFAA